jgi:hypothetical protein
MSMKYRRRGLALAVCYVIAVLVLGVGAASAAGPTVAATVASNTATGTAHTLNLPSGVVSGSLVVMLACLDSGTGTVTWDTAGWVELRESTATRASSVAYLRATASASTVGLTSSTAARIAYVGYRLSGHHPSTNPNAATTPATGNSASPAPPTVTASGGAAENRFIVTSCHDGNPNAVTGWPTNYTEHQIQDAVSGVSTNAAMASRVLNAAVDPTPGTLAITTSTNWAAHAVVVPPLLSTPSSAGLLIGVQPP